MTLPPNLPAKNCYRENYDHVQPYRPDVSADQIESAKQRLCAREAKVVDQIQYNARERIARRKAFIEQAKRVAKARGMELTPRLTGAILAASKIL